MAQYGMLREYSFTDPAEDIRGSKIYGLDDEKLGKIKDVIFDHATGQITYLVVDTGGWLTTKEFLVPANRLRASAKHQDDFEVDLTKEQIESFPPYNETDLESEQQWADYEGKYRSKWEDSPVMHRSETDRNITPTTKQMKDALPAGGTPVTTKEDPAEFAGFAAGTDTVEINQNATGIGDRWDTFQDRLRERRKEVIGTRPDDLRKAS